MIITSDNYTSSWSITFALCRSTGYNTRIVFLSTSSQ